MNALLSALLTCFALADAAGSSGHGDGHSTTDTTQSYAFDWNASWTNCALLPKEKLMDKHKVGGYTDLIALMTECWMICPDFKYTDYKSQCSHGHAFHSAYSEYQEKVTYHASLQWKVGFLVFCILIGAICRYVNPSWMPYTVSLLIVFVILGIIAGVAIQAPDCPINAYYMTFLSSTPGYVDQYTWSAFTGTQFAPGSYCASLACGSEDANNCRWKFEDLDKKFKLSLMLPESVDAGAGDGKLSADELWTFECNFLRDLLSLADMDPHVLLVVFLPPLLFESACFGIDMGIFKKQLPQIVLMAFPGMIMSSVITGLLVWAAVPQWTFWVCWLIGVIASATDPVAVVALLKDLGAPKTLGTLIEGESLLNDGSAVVLFVWVRNVIGYTYSTAAPEWMAGDGSRYSGEIGIEFVRVVAQMLFYGLFFGFLFGKLLRVMLRGIYNDKYIEGSLVIGMTYFAFWFSELFMGTSAVLAVVIMGLYINYNKSCISPEVLHFLHLFYEMSAHMLNTIIFAIAGAKLGLLSVDQSISIGTMVFPSLGTILAIYPIILLARGLSIAILFPLVSRLGTGCTWKEAVIMWWGGLRGSVGLALALALLHTAYDDTMWGSEPKGDWIETELNGDKIRFPKLDCRDQPFTVVMMTLIVVSTTVIINGLTMAPLMRFLKMTELPSDRKFMLNEAHEHLAQKIRAYIIDLENKPEFKGVQWAGIESDIVQQQKFDVEDKEKEKAAWLAVLNMERANFLLQFENGILSAEAFHRLENFVADLSAHAAGKDSAELSKLYDEEFAKMCSGLKEGRNSDVSYQVAIAYLNAMAEVSHITHDKGSFAKVADEHKDNLEKMQQELSAYTESNGSHLSIMQQRALLLVLLKQRGIVEHMLHEGELKDLDAVPLISEINKKIHTQYVKTVTPFKQDVTSVHPVSVVPNADKEPL
eukprot:CAMPEP_0197632526 /NCGR_PEP_ID=MMETSP1338-20131121/9231_1 /TAXON_ID=43686 ORGANISM="Pelagodinium beii, Strain RCC1491" /NCGR_SAMPLE_ID=MMETSP1338 /ASSEMBLY_ACC=CAM_ASM_000754 /LENGTH=930 /DNA_ID=CAMNT_0043204089 /DNA_START=71 /DNA_END=2863 /DNA_ORIENTATION=+